MDADSDDEAGPPADNNKKKNADLGIKAEQLNTGGDEATHYDDSSYYKDLTEYTPNPQGDIKPQAYMSNAEFEQVCAPNYKQISHWFDW